MRVHHPPGRSGRVWLRARIDIAARATDLLEQKERVLLREQRRLRVLVRHTETSWNDTCRDAQTWAARASALRGRGAVALLAATSPATAELRWRNAMGAYYPAEVSCRLPAPQALGDAGTAAMHEAVRAHRDALTMAVEHAAAQRAASEVEREVTATRRRLRMLRHRWLPALRAALASLDSSLEELEREAAIQRRWARNREEVLR